MAAPTSISEPRWQQIIDDAARFIADWGVEAARLGWSERDLFSVPPGPERWLIRTGLIGLLRGRPVVSLTAEAITIRNHRGTSHRYRRSQIVGAVMVWAANAYSEDPEKR